MAPYFKNILSSYNERLTVLSTISSAPEEIFSSTQTTLREPNSLIKKPKEYYLGLPVVNVCIKKLEDGIELWGLMGTEAFSKVTKYTKGPQANILKGEIASYKLTDVEATNLYQKLNK